MDLLSLLPETLQVTDTTLDLHRGPWQLRRRQSGTDSISTKVLMLKVNAEFLRLPRQRQEKHNVVCKDNHLPTPGLLDEALRHVLTPMVVQ